ncbi:MAG: NPCBM/NEW2 domain-containing protein [Planctomycetota bacterium]|nr:NPCBM/NEW2 domain-containing protein [Planctomycetota bacterium]MDA1114480.1 NPCBM/NEW2 domain-containing protein [Planctomycetota bacterium]
MILLFITLLLTCQNPQAGPEVRIITDAGPVQAALLGWQDGHPLVDSKVAVDSWWSVDFPNASGEVEGWTLALSDGAWLPGQPVIGAEKPTWMMAGLPGVKALEIDTLWLEAFGRERLPQVEEDRDQLWARTSSGGLDRLRGYLLEWTPQGITFETSVKELFVEWEQVDGLALLPESVPQQKQAVWIQLVNGGVLSARILHAEEKVLHLELPWGTPWDLPFASVRRIRQRSGVEEWALQNWKVQEMPQAEALDWTPRVGKSVEGRPLRLHENQVFAQGIGVQARTVLTKTASTAGTLLLNVGVDQEVEHFRSPQAVVFQVLLDGEILITSAPKHVGEEVQTVLVRIPRAGEIQLIASPSGVLPFGGHADWCDIVWKPEK